MSKALWYGLLALTIIVTITISKQWSQPVGIVKGSCG